MTDANRYSKLIEAMLERYAFRSAEAKYGYMLGHTGALYALIEHVFEILKDTKKGDPADYLLGIERAEAFLSSLLRLNETDANNQNTI